MSDPRKADLKLIRKWQLAAIDHLEDLNANASVIIDSPFEDDDAAMVNLTVIMPREDAVKFVRHIASKFNHDFNAVAIILDPGEETRH